MSSIKDKINILKWQIISRLPNGGIYERAIFRLLLDKNLDPDKIDYYIYWFDIHKSAISAYLFATYLLENEDHNNFFQYLNKNYTTRNDGFFTFNIDGKPIHLPIPLESDQAVYRGELLDLIVPYLAGYPSKKVPFYEGPYEYNSVFLKKKDVVLDLGANCGMFSAFASSKECDVYAFEPLKPIIDRYLSKTANANGGITILNKAVSNKIGTELIGMDLKNMGASSLVALNNNPLNHRQQQLSVETDTIDNFVSTQGLKSVGFIKADIEGAERYMLEGAKETLKEYAPNLAICYYHRLDDLKAICRAILAANPEYLIKTRWKKVYAHVNHTKKYY